MFGTVVWSGSSWSGVGEFEPRQVIIWKDQQSGTHIFRVRNTSCRRSLTVHAIAVKSSMAVLLWSLKLIIINRNVLRECKPLSMPKFQAKVIQDSNPDCPINPDLHLVVCEISPKMLWIFITLSVSVTSLHFVKIGRLLWEMLINLVKSAILQWWGKWKIDPESISETGAPPKVT